MSAALAPVLPAEPSGPEVIPLALLDGYKVRWSRETVARDIVQNFFDEVDDFRQVDVEVDAARRVVLVRGPSRFDLEYLRYIGATTKAGRRAAGGFGEGFKVCALVLVRDFHCAVTAGSGAWEIRPFLRPMKLGNELCYEVRRRAAGDEHPGSFVRLEGADERLCEVFASAKELFRHPDNPRLASPIYVDDHAGVGIFAAKDDKKGDLYYRRQHRGYLRFALGDALTFALDDRLDGLEGDRDRRDIMGVSSMIAAVVAKVPDAVLTELVLHLRAYWHHGGMVLTAVLAEAARRGLRVAFPRRWLARVDRGGYFLERHAVRVGYHLGVQRLAGLGMPTLLDRFGASQAPRRPTPVEVARMTVARDLYVLLAGEEPLYGKFRVVEVEPPMGDFRGPSCVVPAASLAASFGEGIAVCMARLACGNGLRSRRNADRLTALLDGALARSGTLDPFAERWAAAAVDPSREGQDLAPDDDDEPREDYQRRRLIYAILAPPGFPPAEALEARIKKLAAAKKINAWSTPAPVTDLRSALEQYARGVPSVWIGGTEIEPPKGRRASFEVRTFEAAGGERALLPTDEVLAAAIEAEAVGGIRAIPRAPARARIRKEKGSYPFLCWLCENAPAEFRALVEGNAISRAQNAAEGAMQDMPWPAHSLAAALAKRAIARMEHDNVEIDGIAEEAFAGAVARVRGLLAAIVTHAPGVLDARPGPEMACRALCERAGSAVAGGAAEESALAEAVAAAPAVADICGWLDVAPLDSNCARACVVEALTRFWEVTDGAPASKAPAAVRERFDDAVGHAEKRHGELDANGNTPSCYEIYQALGERYGRPVPVAVNGPPKSAAAVRAAWDEAIAAGLGEIEAARRCLEIAARAPGEG